MNSNTKEQLTQKEIDKLKEELGTEKYLMIFGQGVRCQKKKVLKKMNELKIESTSGFGLNKKTKFFIDYDELKGAIWQ